MANLTYTQSELHSSVLQLIDSARSNNIPSYVRMKETIEVNDTNLRFLAHHLMDSITILFHELEYVKDGNSSVVDHQSLDNLKARCIGFFNEVGPKPPGRSPFEAPSRAVERSAPPDPPLAAPPDQNGL